MEKSFKIVHGIKLYERTCTQCPLTFWVPKSSKQLTCGEFCHDKYTKTNFRQRKKRRRGKAEKVKRGDYA